MCKLLMLFILYCILSLGLTDLALASVKQITLSNFFINQQTYIINEQTHQMDAAPFIDANSRTMVPIRFLSYAIGVPEDGII